MTKLQKGVLGAAVALAFSGSSAVYGAGSILFDPTGTGGGTILVDTFDWAPGNALAIGALSTAPGPGGGVDFQLVAQGRLGSFVQPGGNTVTAPAGTEFTFQISFFETGLGIGTATSGFLGGPQPLTSSFTIYRDTVSDSNPITGAGFGASGTSVAILHGTLVSAVGNYTNQTLLFPAQFPTVLLDQLNADNQNGTLTQQGNGSTTIQVNVDFQNNAFFRTNVSSLTVDLQDTTNNQDPFRQTDPSDQVFGVTPFYTVSGGQRINGLSNGCVGGGQDENGNPGARCDIHLQTDASSSFNPTLIPEPGMLALFGLALGAFGVSARRREQARG